MCWSNRFFVCADGAISKICKACLTYLQKVAILKSRNGKLTLHIEGKGGVM